MDELSRRLSGRQLELFHAIIDQQQQQQGGDEDEANSINCSAITSSADGSAVVEDDEQHNHRLSIRQKQLKQLIDEATSNLHGSMIRNDNSPGDGANYQPDYNNYLTTKHDMDTLASRACELACSRDDLDAEYNIDDLLDDSYASRGLSDGVETSHSGDEEAGEEYYDDSDDSDVEGEGQQSEIDLANRTSQIMSTFRDYLSDIESNSPGGIQSLVVPTKQTDGDNSSPNNGERYLKRGSDGDLTAVELRSSFNLDSSDQHGCCLKREWNLHSVDNEEESRLQHELQSERRRYYRCIHPMLHSKKFRRKLILAIVGVCACIILIVGINQLTDDDRQGNSEQEGSNDSTQTAKIIGQGGQSSSAIIEMNERIEPGDGSSSMQQQPQLDSTKEGEEIMHTIQDETIQTDDFYRTQDKSDVTSSSGVSVQMNEGSTISAEINLEPNESVHSSVGQAAEIDNAGSKGEGASTYDNDGNPSSSDIATQYEPKWYDRSTGWVGKTYIDAIAFCASTQESYIPCPYEAICPNSSGSVPTGGIKEYTAESWAPIIDAPNSWVNVGLSSEYSSIAVDSCATYNDVHSTPPFWGVAKHVPTEDDEVDHSPHVMCCKAPKSGLLQSRLDQAGRHDLNSKPSGILSESTAQVSTETGEAPATVTDVNQQTVMDRLHPLWFGRKHGYHGTTYQEAADFCKSVGDMHLCPKDAYCPDGAGSGPTPLYLNREAFRGEQWAPVANTEQGVDNEKVNYWVLIGTIDDLSWSTCMTYDQIHNDKPEPTWGLDGSQPELKENILCCQNPNNLLKEQNFARQLDPIWLDESHGWTGGSHEDAMNFCGTLGKRKLCPYAAYCPHGPGMPVMGGHTTDFNGMGEQWAPIYGEMNHWVQIGQKYGNSATTCMDNLALEGGEPEWGLNEEKSEMKNHIMCCSF